MGQAIGKTQRIGSHTVQLVKQIAEGGFAFVYLVKESSTGRQYALKRIIIQDHEQISLIQYEINVMRQISSPEHPHIVKFYDSSIVERSSGHGQIGEAYILMEYCSSHLVDIMNTRMHHRFAENEVLQIFHEICDAVSHLHAQDPPIAHRDLKVENVLFDSGKYKLCDFGSCTTRVVPAQGRTKSVISKLEEEIQKFTTLPYRPPEMVDLYREAEISEKVDIWALGCLLYKLMYYTTPFEESGALQILNVNYTIPSHPHYSEKLQDLIRFLLNPTPESRPDIWEVLSMISELRGLPPPNRRRSKKTTPVQQQQLQAPLHSSQSQNVSPVLGQAKPPPHPNSHPLSLSTPSEPSRPERQQQQQQQQQPPQVSAATKPLQSSSTQPPSISPSNSPSLTVPNQNPSIAPLSSPQARRLNTPNPLASSTPALLKPAPSTPNRRGRPSHSRSGSDDNSNSTIVVPSLNNNIVIIPPPQQNISILSPPQPLNNHIRKVNVSTEAIDGMVSRERQLEQHVLTATGPESSIDMVAVEWLITHTWSTQNSTRILENITRRPLTETIVCLKSLVVTHRVLGAGHQRSLKDATPVAPLFQNLHIGWMKQLEKIQSQPPSNLNLAKVVAAYCLIIYKKIMFHHFNPLISGNMHIDSPHPVLVATATPENSGTIHASHMTVLQLLDILKDIVSMQPMLVSLQNNNTNTPSSPSTQVDIAELLLVTVGNLLQEAFHAYALITYVLSIFVNKENTPDISDLTSNSNPNFLHDLVARYQTMFPIFFEFFISMAQAFPTVVGWGSWAVCGLCGVPQLPKVTPNLNIYPPTISTPPPNTLQTYQHTHNATPHANSRAQVEADASDLFGNDASDPFWSTSNAPPKSLSESFNVSPPSSPIRSNASPAPPKDRRATLERLASSPTLLTPPSSDTSLSPFDLQQGGPSTSQQQQQQQQKNSVLAGMLSPRLSAKSGGNVSLSSSDPPSPTLSPTILNIPFVSNPTPAPPTPYPAAIPIFINNNTAHIINSSTNNGSKPHRRSISNTTEVLRKQQNQLDAAQDLLLQQLEYQKRMFIQMKDSSNFISIPEESFRNDKGAHPIALSGSDDGIKKPKKRSGTANDVHLNKSILSQLDWFD